MDEVAGNEGYVAEGTGGWRESARGREGVRAGRYRRYVIGGGLSLVVVVMMMFVSAYACGELISVDFSLE